jgi:hypothetical protein
MQFLHMNTANMSDWRKKVMILKGALSKHGDGSYEYRAADHYLEINRNWQPIAGYPHKYVYWVRKAGTDELVTKGTGNTIFEICDVCKWLIP